MPRPPCCACVPSRASRAMRIAESATVETNRCTSAPHFSRQHPPNLLRRRRHLQILAALAQRVAHRDHDGADAACRAGFTDALDAERIGRRQHRVIGLADFGHVGRVWNGVVHERAGDQLSRRVVGQVLHQRLAERVRDAALHLARDDDRDRARGRNRRPRCSGSPASRRLIGIDLDFGDVAAVRKRLRRLGDSSPW